MIYVLTDMLGNIVATSTDKFSDKEIERLSNRFNKKLTQMKRV